MDELLARALDTARRRGARYADVRLVDTGEQNLALKNGLVEGISHVESAGLGVRVLVGQGWGFAATRDLRPARRWTSGRFRNVRVGVMATDFVAAARVKDAGFQ